MPKLSDTKRAELEAFWRAHLDGWAASDLNQREYCEAHGLPLKRFGNWRATFKHEVPTPARKLLWRGGPGHMASHMSDKEIGATSTGYIPSAASMPDGRRNFRVADKRRIVAEAMSPGTSLSTPHGVYDFDPRNSSSGLFDIAVLCESPCLIGYAVCPVRTDALSYPTSSSLASCSE